MAMTVSNHGYVCAPGEPGVGCAVSGWLQGSVVPPVPNWLLVVGVAVWGVWAIERKGGRA